MSKYFNSRFARGPLAQHAHAVARAGRFGDTHLVHLNAAELRVLRKQWGEPTINPATGLPEFFSWGDALSVLAPMAVGAWAPQVGETIGKYIPGVSGDTASQLGSAVAGGGLGALLGGGWKGALTGASMGALGGGAGSSIGGLLSANPQTAQMLGNALLGAGAGVGTGVGAGKGALAAGLATRAWPSVQQSLAGSPLGGLVGAATNGAGSPGAPQGGTSSGQGRGVAEGATPAGWSNKDLGLGIPTGMAPEAGIAQAGTSAPPPGLPDLLKKYWPVILAGLQYNALKNQSQQVAKPPPVPPEFTQSLPQVQMNRTPTPYKGNYYTYGENPEHSFMTDTFTQKKADGGSIHAGAGPLSQASRYVKGAGSGRSDGIDARLSDGEFVMDAETVSMLGDGSSDAGAKKLDELRTNLRKHKSKGLGEGKMSPNAKAPGKYLKKPLAFNVAGEG